MYTERDNVLIYWSNFIMILINFLRITFRVLHLYKICKELCFFRSFHTYQIEHILYENIRMMVSTTLAKINIMLFIITPANRISPKIKNKTVAEIITSNIPSLDQVLKKGR